MTYAILGGVVAEQHVNGRQQIRSQIGMGGLYSTVDDPHHHTAASCRKIPCSCGADVRPGNPAVAPHIQQAPGLGKQRIVRTLVEDANLIVRLGVKNVGILRILPDRLGDGREFRQLQPAQPRDRHKFLLGSYTAANVSLRLRLGNAAGAKADENTIRRVVGRATAREGWLLIVIGLLSGCERIAKEAGKSYEQKKGAEPAPTILPKDPHVSQLILQFGSGLASVRNSEFGTIGEVPSKARETS